jgi:uncharacterized protein YegL
MTLGFPEFVDNPENRCPVLLLLDNSGSMNGAAIAELNRGIASFKEDVLKDEQASLTVDLALVTFGKTVEKVQDFVSIDRFQAPVLKADGYTPMGAAIEYALDLIEERKIAYKSNAVQYYRPWIFMITDGAPTDQWEIAARRLQQAEEENRVLFFAVGVQGADMSKLRQIASPQRPPLLLNGLDFRSLFLWLSSSMKRVSTGKIGDSVSLPPVGWGTVGS